MSAADKVALMNTFYGADICAFAAAGTEFIVNDCKIVYNLYSAVLAGFFAFHTADTAV